MTGRVVPLAAATPTSTLQVDALERAEAATRLDVRARRMSFAAAT